MSYARLIAKHYFCHYNLDTLIIINFAFVALTISAGGVSNLAMGHYGLLMVIN